VALSAVDGGGNGPSHEIAGGRESDPSATAIEGALGFDIYAA